MSVSLPFLGAAKKTLLIMWLWAWYSSCLSDYISSYSFPLVFLPLTCNPRSEVFVVWEMTLAPSDEAISLFFCDISGVLSPSACLLSICPSDTQHTNTLRLSAFRAVFHVSTLQVWAISFFSRWLCPVFLNALGSSIHWTELPYDLAIPLQRIESRYSNKISDRYS